jgi:hypothetical protein
MSSRGSGPSGRGKQKKMGVYHEAVSMDQEWKEDFAFFPDMGNGGVERATRELAATRRDCLL